MQQLQTPLLCSSTSIQVYRVHPSKHRLWVEAQSRQSAGLFFQSSELVTLAGGGSGGSQFGRGDRHCGTLGTLWVEVTVQQMLQRKSRMPDPRTAATATPTITEAGASRTAAEATEAAVTGVRAADQAATTGPAGRHTCLPRGPTNQPAKDRALYLFFNILSCYTENPDVFARPICSIAALRCKNVVYKKNLKNRVGPPLG
jgi:hypothetical protein